MVDDHTLFLKDYTTYWAIVENYPVFETIESVRTCKRMLEKQITPTYKKAQKYKYIQVERKTVPGTFETEAENLEPI
jgi:hypothetical protein